MTKREAAEEYAENAYEIAAQAQMAFNREALAAMQRPRFSERRSWRRGWERETKQLRAETEALRADSRGPPKSA